MKELAIRLKCGTDLKDEIINFLKNQKVNTAVVISSVGCLKEINIRLAGAKETLSMTKDLEIVSLNGTYSKGSVHLHISVADDKGHVFGGHLMSGSIVNTTCELVFGVLETIGSHREYDSMTGYDEIAFMSIDE